MFKNKFFKSVCVISAAAVALSVSACGLGSQNVNTPNTPVVNNTVSLNLDEYAVEFKGSGSEKAVNTATNIGKLANADFKYTHNGLIYYSDSSGYGVYNLERDKIILSGLAVAPDDVVISEIIPALREQKVSGVQVVYDYTCACDGTKLITDCTGAPAASLTKIKLAGDTEKSEILTVTANVLGADGEESVTKHFRIVRSVETGEIDELTGVILAGTSAGNGYDVDDDYNALSRTPVYDCEEEIEGAISEYSYGVYGNSMVFYNGKGQETGSVRLTNAKVLGFVSNYMYYVSQLPVFPEATSGFNYIENGDKFLYTLYKYDIINNNATTFSFEAVLTQFEPIYNSKKKAFDAVVISGYGFSNGIAYCGYNQFCHIADGELRSAYDLDKFGGLDGLYSLGEKLYFTGRYIVDDQLKIKTEAGAENIFLDQELVSVTTENSAVGFIDFNGKIIISPAYAIDTKSADYTESAPIKFYGDAAYLLKYGKDGSTYKVLVDKTGKEVNLSDKELNAATRSVKISVYGGFYETLTIETGAKRVQYTYDYYSYAGIKLLTLTAESVDGNFSAEISCKKVGGSYVLIEKTDSVTNYYKIS